MRKLPCLVFLLILSGCESQDISKLTFDESLRDSYRTSKDGSPEVKRDYKNSILSLLEEQGIETSKVDIRISPDDDNSVILSARRSIADSQSIVSFHEALTDIVESREELPLKIVFRIEQDKLSSSSPEIQERLAELPELIEAELVPEDVTLSHYYSIGTMLEAGINGSDRTSSAIYCNISATVEPRLPSALIDYLRNEEEKSEPSDLSPEDRGVTLSFNNAHLQSLLERQKITVVPTVNRRGRAYPLMVGKRSDMIDFQLGSLGVIPHEYGRIDRMSYTSLRGQCRSRAIEIGQPFTFYLGYGMDRLVSFTPLISQD
ncbi:hypothetical protein ACUY1T_09740 [Billgrantia sp. Q4P2]|uniref:hypothetical protein n=1 Tax=Billgrantia sp. Q4P2 TaxID=3463857 RepID=UPI0040568CDA